MKIRWVAYSFAFVVFFLLTTASYAAPQISASLEKDEISLDDEAVLVVRVLDVERFQPPVIPHVDGLTIVATSSISVPDELNGRLTILRELRYTLVADNEGEYKIPPFSIFVQGAEYKTQPLMLRVTKNNNTTQSQTTLQNQGVSPFDNSQGKKFRFKLATSVNNRNPYLGEQILFSFRIYTSEHISQASAAVLPDFKDFIAEKLVDGRRGVETVGGIEYATSEIVYSLMPVKEGTIEIGPASLGIVYQDIDRNARQWDPFSNNSLVFNFGNSFGVQKKTVLNAPAFSVQVKPLPQPIPADFTGLVGDVGVQTSFSAQQVTVGESVTYEVQFSGQGNIKEASLPSLAFNGFKVYYDKPQVEMMPSTNGIISGRKSFKIALVPTQSGSLVIPAFTFSYFDPKKGAYVSLSVEQKTITVLPAKDEPTNVLLQPSNPSNGNLTQNAPSEIRPLFPDPGAALRGNPLVVPDWIYFFIVLGLPLIFVIVVLSKTLHFENQASMKRQVMRKSRRDLLACLKSRKTSVAEVLEALRLHVSALFGVSGQALTAQDIHELCVRNQLSPDVSKRLVAIVEQFEAAQYGAGHAVDVTALKKALLVVVDQLE